MPPCNSIFPCSSGNSLSLVISLSLATPQKSPPLLKGTSPLSSLMKNSSYSRLLSQLSQKKGYNAFEKLPQKLPESFLFSPLSPPKTHQKLPESFLFSPRYLAFFLFPCLCLPQQVTTCSSCSPVSTYPPGRPRLLPSMKLSSFQKRGPPILPKKKEKLLSRVAAAKIKNNPLLLQGGVYNELFD